MSAWRHECETIIRERLRTIPLDTSEKECRKLLSQVWPAERWGARALHPYNMFRKCVAEAMAVRFKRERDRAALEARMKEAPAVLDGEVEGGLFS